MEQLIDTTENQLPLNDANRQTVMGRILRPLGKLVHPFRGHDPLHLDMYPLGEGPDNPWPSGISLGEAPLGADEALAVISRIEINQRFGWEPTAGIPKDLLDKYFY